jgi:hypothetical protein
VLEEVGGIMALVGWNDSSLDFYTEIDFKSTPSWIRFLALTPVLEKYAYPVAVRRGFGTIWISQNSARDIDVYLFQGWQVKVGEPGDRERFFSGSLAQLSLDGKPIKKPRARFTRLGRDTAWRKAIHEANGTLRYLEEKASPFNKTQN